MVLINTIDISPPLLNSSCAWSSDLKQLTELYESEYTGAITTRTATLKGFEEDEKHTVAFTTSGTTTINSYGYSPHPLSQYLTWVEEILTTHASFNKAIIISITASTAGEIAQMVDAIQELRTKLLDNQRPSGKTRIGVELNTSCPNISYASPSGYSFKSLWPLVIVLGDAFAQDPTLTLGMKLPPYTHMDQYMEVMAGLRSLAVTPPGREKTNPFAFLTCTNTLGNSLLFSEQTVPKETGDKNEGKDAEKEKDDTKAKAKTSQFAVPPVLGGLAGDGLHPLALGNVYRFRQMLSEESKETGLSDIKIIGVGGVTSKEAAERMRKAGADVIACATLFGKEGVRAFEILGKD
ncbi:unnamed protein product [Cyclocybe aegerita]|uniref:Dihydroorotate oxidase n=1 Tax=Cyclocybe aegerita TaxID=1973307 RepID=A0A8S0W7C8_CYCAE|nr:unnamed protein product [Cyclocybe aegerita]